MHSDYDKEANAIAITLVDSAIADRADQRHKRAIVALRDGEPVSLELLYPNLGIDEPLRAVAERYELDLETLTAAATAALAAPDRAVTVEVAARSTI
ncbi:MAG TPA: hypothetical protein VFY48_02970 [Solirubrobacterales bacterium]|nr:hypothetical protein [Solirubrobacterales bacterium]